ncbi:Uncharacterised protein [Streptococcus suis]|nr:Uncharacterised protein [Streptococcus suis]
MTKGYQQRFSLSILLWMRQDKARKREWTTGVAGMHRLLQLHRVY